MRGLTEALQSELAGSDVTVLIVHPRAGHAPNVRRTRSEQDGAERVDHIPVFFPPKDRLFNR